MRVAVITPYYKENTDVLRRCYESVLKQTYPVTHIMVADGNSHPWIHSQPIEHIVLPVSHGDAGATPRAIGAISAFSRGYDAVAFLDADNWYEPKHIQHMVETAESNQADIVSATRIIVLEDANVGYVDGFESVGEKFTDTNCMFLRRSTLRFMTQWIAEPGKTLWSDRSFWQSLMSADLKMARCSEPTVAYVTKWAAHYVSVNMVPPPDSVWIDYDAEGNLMHVKHKDVKL